MEEGKYVVYIDTADNLYKLGEKEELKERVEWSSKEFWFKTLEEAISFLEKNYGLALTEFKKVLIKEEIESSELFHLEVIFKLEGRKSFEKEEPVQLEEIHYVYLEKHEEKEKNIN
jgi:hypothetical protein